MEVLVPGAPEQVGLYGRPLIVMGFGHNPHPAIRLGRRLSWAPGNWIGLNPLLQGHQRDSDGHDPHLPDAHLSNSQP